jgi:hypothetical protein
MKQITNKTILKQGDKTYQPIEHDGNIHWVDSSILVGMEGDWVVAQSQPKLDGIPVVSLDSYVDRIAKEILPDDSNWQRRFDIVKGFKSNSNHYTQADIDKAIKLARPSYKKNNFVFSKEEIRELINSISVIEVDEHFNILGYG